MSNEDVKIKGHSIRELKFVGFWDSCFFKPNKESGGILFQTKSGERLRVTHLEIEKAKKRSNNAN